MAVLVERRYKMCVNCERKLDITKFQSSLRTKDKRMSWCRECTDAPKGTCLVASCGRGAWRVGFCSPHYKRYLRHGDPLGGRTPMSPGKSASVRRAYVHEYLLEQGCDDCGYNKDARALSFDHRPGTVKVRDVKAGQQFGWKALLEEIAKCDVVCMNCHVIRTSERRKEVMLSNATRK